MTTTELAPLPGTVIWHFQFTSFPQTVDVHAMLVKSSSVMVGWHLRLEIKVPGDKRASRKIVQALYDLLPKSSRGGYRVMRRLGSEEYRPGVAQVWQTDDASALESYAEAKALAEKLRLICHEMRVTLPGWHSGWWKL
jgi:hypothetical protein